MGKFNKLDMEMAYLAGIKSETGDVEYSEKEKQAIDKNFEKWLEWYTEDNENK
jgi:hypothetical protein